MSKQTTFPKYEVLNVEIDALTIAEANHLITDHAANPTSAAWYVTKPYSEFIDGVITSPARKAYLDQANLCLPDGIGICWATVFRYGGGRHWWRIITTGVSLILHPKSAYQFLPEKFAGPNAAWPLLELAAQRGLKVFLIGSPKNSSITKTVQTIQTKLPNLAIVGQLPGEIAGLTGPKLLAAVEAGLDLTELVATVNTSGADIILIGMGFPLQEAIMSRLQPLLRHGVMIGEGGTFDYDSFGGHQVRAPKLVQNIGLEWLWRLAHNPSRLGRQLAIPRLIWQVYREPR
ncbi:WecB/TagA/CpsF family glycosyltransferase [Candidatus Saccharibacteria bacterium]|nr:WecB/TagA/CpsF family glycosyltransferase [Candidatus Saccharibacteria bacterium]